MWKWHPRTTSSTCFSNVKLASRTTPSSLMDSVKSMRVPETSIPLDKWSCGSRLLSLVTDPSQFVLIQNLFMALNRFLCADVMCHEENTPSLGMFEIDMQSSLCIQKYRQKCLKKIIFISYNTQVCIVSIVVVVSGMQLLRLLRLRSAIRRHYPPQRAVLSQICCFGERKVVLFQILLDSAEPCDAGTT